MAFRHYGRIIEGIIEDLANEDESEEKQKKMLGLANLMKKTYLSWNRDSVNDEVIIKDLKKMSGGRLTLPIETVLATNNDLAPMMVQQQTQQRGGKKKRRKNNNKNRRRNSRN